jgi:RNA-dependent RNA polymerase
MNGAPGMFLHLKDMADMKWFQTDLHEICLEKDLIFKYAFPFILVFKVDFDEYNDDFERYIDKTKCIIEPKEICDIEHMDYPLPNYENFFETVEKWEVKYMLLVLITYNYLSLDMITVENLEIIQNCENAERVLEEFYNNYENFSIQKFREYADEIQLSTETNFNENQVSVRKVRFTPSGIIFDPAEKDVSNRAIRKFKTISSNFYLRVSIEDENGEKRIWRQCNSILNKFRNNLKNLEILGRSFEFLGFSNSQMKNHSCWLLSPESGFTADQVRAELGDFHRCKNNSKYASRLGLCFSGTYRTVNLKIKKIPDIERNNYVFTDGIGKISPTAMESVKSCLKIPSNISISAVQVRIAGCKGVLALNTECEEVEVRPSMDKFDSTDNDLEVCSYSAYRLGFLNRQIILLLEGRGVKPEVFIRLQKNITEELDQALVDEHSALKMISGQDFYYCSKMLNYMLMKGVKIKDEPFLNRMITAIYQDKMQDIKGKARILAPHSLILMGIVDEYALLEYGECFVFPSNREEPIVGKCVIAKNPCLHPGDVRVLKAVDKPQLRYLKDVVIFPQKGKRPHPNECSGSDLDGDMYFVTWNTELIPLVEHEEPMDYSAPPEKVENPSIEGVIEFFIKYMESENLGNIANTHLAQADKSGIYNRNVITLAELHSKAVDYPKTGVPAIIPLECRVREWPDFMGKSEDKSYESKKSLGIMYRMISDKKVESFIPLANPLYLFPGREKFYNTAKEMYKNYSLEMKRYMRQYDTKSEFEFLSLNPGDRIGKRGRFDSKQKMMEAVENIIHDLFHDFHTFAETNLEKQQLASACYWVSYRREMKNSKLVSKFLSFPWVFFEYLLIN